MQKKIELYCKGAQLLILVCLHLNRLAGIFYFCMFLKLHFPSVSKKEQRKKNVAILNAHWEYPSFLEEYQIPGLCSTPSSKTAWPEALLNNEPTEKNLFLLYGKAMGDALWDAASDPSLNALLLTIPFLPRVSLSDSGSGKLTRHKQAPSPPLQHGLDQSSSSGATASGSAN